MTSSPELKKIKEREKKIHEKKTHPSQRGKKTRKKNSKRGRHFVTKNLPASGKKTDKNSNGFVQEKPKPKQKKITERKTPSSRGRGTKESHWEQTHQIPHGQECVAKKNQNQE